MMGGASPASSPLAGRVRTWAAAAPDLRRPWRDVPWTALDLETTGLDPRSDAILSVGIVDVDGGRVRLDTAWSSLVRPPPGAASDPAALLVHGLLPDRLAGAPPLEEVLAALADRLCGRVVLAHSGLTFDGPLLDRAFREACGEPFPGPVLDTAGLAHHVHDQAVPGRAQAAPSVRLSDLAARHGIPAGRAHDALDDALACAQLFLVLAARVEASGGATGARLLKLAGA